jgi:DNA-binding XRE family transcriptional regulator
VDHHARALEEPANSDLTPLEQALAEVAAYLQGAGPIGPKEDAALLIEQLARRGLSVQPTPAPVLSDLAPETLRRAREALSITRAVLAHEASMSPSTVTLAEAGRSRTRLSTLRVLGETLVRLGAKRPE